MSELFSFPNPVNEKAARVVAGVVLIAALVALVTSSYWLLIVLAAGFIARTLTGPTLSPLGAVASRIIAPRLGPPKYVAGPPKRFAQGLGAAITTTGAIAAVGFGLHGVGDGLLGALIVAAGLESIFAYCLGCKVFAALMRLGLVPERVCAECADISLRVAAPSPSGQADRRRVAGASDRPTGRFSRPQRRAVSRRRSAPGPGMRPAPPRTRA